MDNINDKAFILTNLKTNPNALKLVSDELKDDKEFVLLAIKQNAMSLKFASNRLKNDKEVAFNAIAKNAFTFKYISNEIKNDKDFLVKAILYNYHILQYIPRNFFIDFEFMKIIFENSKNYSKIIDDPYMDCAVYPSRVIDTILKLNFKHFKHFNNDQEFICNLLKINTRNFELASKKLKNSKSFVLMLIDKMLLDANSFEFVSLKIVNNYDIILKAVSANPSILIWESIRLKWNNNLKIMYKAIKTDKDAFYVISTKIQDKFRNPEELINFVEIYGIKFLLGKINSFYDINFYFR